MTNTKNQTLRKATMQFLTEHNSDLQKLKHDLSGASPDLNTLKIQIEDIEKGLMSKVTTEFLKYNAECDKEYERAVKAKKERKTGNQSQSIKETEQEEAEKAATASLISFVSPPNISEEGYEIPDADADDQPEDITPDDTPDNNDISAPDDSETNSNAIQITAIAVTAPQASTNPSLDIDIGLQARSKKWKIPTKLTPTQIADVINFIFPVKRICCCPQNTDSDYDLLGIYITEALSKLLDMPESEGIYVTSDDVFYTMGKWFDYTMTKKDFDEMMISLKSSVKRVRRCQDPNLVAVGNGIFDTKTKTRLPFSEELVFLTKSPVEYDENAVNPQIQDPKDNTIWDVESWMSTLSDDPEIVELLWQITGAVIRPNVRWNKSAWLYSETGNNGKGTLCEMMRALCGETSYAAIPLSDFSKDFALEPLTRASAIIVDENDVGSFIDKAGNLKSIITNDVVQINRKFKTPIAYQFYGFMVQCLNEYPRIRDKSDSFYRRQLFIPMTKCFTGIEKPYIKTEYLHNPDVLKYILKRVLTMDYDRLSEPESCKIALQEYKENNDPVRQFWDEMREEFVWDLLPFSFLYEVYKAWFKTNLPSGIVTGKMTFINDLLSVTFSDPDWLCPDKRQKIRTRHLMDKPEPLIAKMGIDKWYNGAYKGTDPMKIGKVLNPAESYRGLQRVIKEPEEDTEEDE